MKQVVKRDGKEVKFNLKKIVSAIRRAGESSGEFGYDEALDLTNSVIQMFDNKEKATVEEIQDAVEKVLNENNYTKTARAFIVYREKHNDMRKDNSVMIDAVQSIDDYLDRSDWRVNANANQGYSLGGMILNTSGKVTANYWLSHVYPKEAGEAHRNGDIYIHDLDFLAGYCAGWSLRSLLREGFNGVKGKVESKPPKHLASALGQMVNFLGTLQNEWSGAQAFSSFDTYLAPYVRVDNLTYEQVKQNIQEFIYCMNVPSRWGSQSPFSNLTFDLVCPDDLRDQNPIIGDKEVDFTYGELQKEMDMLNKAYIEVMTEGDACGRLFTFPIPTYNITDDFDWNSETSNKIFEMTAKYGLPYFQNFLNSNLDPHSIRSMCCRLRLNLDELLKRGNGLFGSAEQTGSIGVITINCARLGYLYKGDKVSLYKKLDYWLSVAKNALEVKRKFVQQKMDDGLYPFTKRYLGTLRNHFSTIGINGVNEMIRNFTNDEHDITDDYGQQFAIDLMNHIREKLKELQKETETMFNLEGVPGEGCFSYDTEVFTTEGVKKIGEIVGREDLGVLSYNEKKRKREFRRATCIHQTGIKKVLKIVFDNGQELICTPNHPFGVRSWNGQKGEYIKYVEAKDLKIGMRVKSAYKEYRGDDPNGKKYVTFGSKDYLHRMIWEYYNNKDIPEGYVVHHKDFDRLNNDINNLELMSSTEHKSLHLSVRHSNNDCSIKTHCGENNPFFGKKHSEETKNIISQKNKGRFVGDANYCRTPEGRLRMSEIAKAKPAEKTSKYNHEVDTSLIVDLYLKGKTVAEIAKELGGSYTYSLCKGRLTRAGLLQNNHIVKSIEELDIEIPVYNMEVEENHNYFVGGENGVLVHNCTYRLAKEDKKRYPDIIQAGKPEAPYYTNSTQVPVGYSDDPFTVLNLQEELQSLYTGGTALHLYMGEAMSSSESCKTLVKRVLENYHIPYLTITPTFSICPKHGYISGEHKYCPICDEELTSPKQEQCKACND